VGEERKEGRGEGDPGHNPVYLLFLPISLPEMFKDEEERDKKFSERGGGERRERLRSNES